MMHFAKAALSKVLDFLGFGSYIKIPGKGFSDLSQTEVALMIEAFLNDDDTYFETNAITEFILMRYQNPILQQAKEAIEAIHDRNRSDDSPNGLETSGGRAELTALAENLRNSNSGRTS